MAIPTVSWDETTPANSDDRYAGEERIREFKTQVRELIAVDHQMDYANGGQDTDWGWHNKLTLVARGVDPTFAEDSVIVYTKIINNIAEAFCVDEDSNIQQLTSSGSWIVGMTGEVRLWKGTIANIPTGWELCDGQSDRPNLINKFVRCIRTAIIEPDDFDNNTGGSHTKIIIEDEMPTHTHVLSGGSHTHNMLGGDGGTYGSTRVNILSNLTLVGPATTGGPYSLTYAEHTHVLGNTGSGTAYNTRPVYYELAYIIKT